MKTLGGRPVICIPFTSYCIHIRRELVNRRKGNQSERSHKIVFLLLKDEEYWHGWTLYYWPRLELI